LELTLIFENHSDKILHEVKIIVKREDEFVRFNFDAPLELTGDFKITCIGKSCYKFGVASK
jgi:hypothetical protein